MHPNIVTKFFFVTTLIFGAVIWRTVFAEKQPYRLSVVELARLILAGYGFCLVSALPLVWVNHWSLLLQSVVMGLLDVVGFLYRRRQSKANESPKMTLRLRPRRALLLLAAIAVGIACQWKSIYYLYSTHDPSAYLNSAQHIARTGKFFHEDPLAKQAYGHSDNALKPILNATDAPQEFQLTKNYGVIPFDLSKGLGSYHGFFAAPLFLAMGVSLFGEERCIRVHWIHFASLAIILVALVDLLTGSLSYQNVMAAWLLALCPLVAPLYREPLSEPLAAIFFLGIVFAAFRFEEERFFSLALFLVSVVGAICTRVTALMYVPFVLMSVVWWEKKLSRKLSHRYWLALFAAMGSSLLLVMRLSPNYTAHIFTDNFTTFLTHVGVHRSLENLPPIYVIVPILFVLLLLFMTRPLLLLGLNFTLKEERWKRAWNIFFVLLGLGVFIRYVRLVTLLTNNFGGYPFVLFNLDSLLFYACPVMVILGLGFWFHYLRKERGTNLIFVQTFVPFCVFFYFVYRFQPLNVQVNFQRYLLIELVPLSIVGFVALLKPWSKSRHVNWIFPAIVFVFCWNGGLTYAINRFDVCRTAYQSYRSLRDALDELSNPVIVAVKPTWLEQAYLMPLTNGFDIPVTFVNEPFSYADQRALNELGKLGYTPILAVDRATESKELPAFSGNRWNRWTTFDDCYRYSKFDFGAPPLELAERCAHLDLLLSEKTSTDPKSKDPLWRPAWTFREQRLPTSAEHWYGLEVNGPKACGIAHREGPKEIHVKLRFAPEPQWQPPTVLLNGSPVREIQTRALSGKTRHSHLVQFEIGGHQLNCKAWNVVDINFPHWADFTARKADILSVTFRSPQRHKPLLALAARHHR